MVAEKSMRLPLGFGSAAHDDVELRLEAHVEHAVGLVEDEDADVGERDGLALEMIDESAGSRDDDGGLGAERAHLRAVGDAADHERRLESGSEPLGPAVDLLGELPGRRQHQGGGPRGRHSDRRAGARRSGS